MCCKGFEIIDTLKRMYAIQNGAPFSCLFPSDIDNIVKALETVSGRPTGKWIRGEDEENEWCCSICGNDVLFANADFNPRNVGLLYCPNCGTKMDK